MENSGIFYSHLEYFTVIWYILWSCGNVVVVWYIFYRFGILCQEKSGNHANNLKPLPFVSKKVRGVKSGFVCDLFGRHGCPFLSFPV
jgi:hypothetical protein